jgi:hypothetical protein
MWHRLHCGVAWLQSSPLSWNRAWPQGCGLEVNDGINRPPSLCQSPASPPCHLPQPCWGVCNGKQWHGRDTPTLYLPLFGFKHRLSPDKSPFTGELDGGTGSLCAVRAQPPISRCKNKQQPGLPCTVMFTHGDAYTVHMQHGPTNGKAKPYVVVAEIWVRPCQVYTREVISHTIKGQANTPEPISLDAPR